jgi:hypothetical protein
MGTSENDKETLMPAKTIKFAFRGLMVLNDQTDAVGNKFMEIGFFDARLGATGDHSQMGDMTGDSDVHVPRILTMEDGLLSAVFDFRNRRELGVVRNWELEVTKPLQPQVILRKPELTLDRKNKTATNKSDFRFIIDLEGQDMHSLGLSGLISTSNLLMVLKVRFGEFFTRMHSATLDRETVVGGGLPIPYGYAAAVTGCDITFDDNGGGVNLNAVVGSTKRFITSFSPKPDRDTIFEISNSPPDVLTGGPIPRDARNHFHMYYDKLFIDDPTTQFDFLVLGEPPAPDPSLCGVTWLSQRPDPL